MNRILNYYIKKGDRKSAMRIKKGYYIQQLPHERIIRKSKRIQKLFDELRNKIKQ